jgi:hypothetical protein
VSILTKEILDKASEWKSHLELEQFFQKYSITAIVTANEDKKLNTNYRKTLPEGATTENPFSRYDKLGISCEPRDQTMYQKHRHLLAGKTKATSTRLDANIGYSEC